MPRTKSPRNFLKTIAIASPCEVDWNSMRGNDQVRFCEHCQLNVHNISHMTRAQAERLVAKSNGRLCVQYVRDPNGRVVTLESGLKLHVLGRRVSRFAAGAFTAALSVSSAVAQTSSTTTADNASPPAATQTFSASSSLAGTITNAEGKPISGATVSLLNVQLGIALYTSTDYLGRYRLDNLRSASYEFRVVAPGYLPNEQSFYYIGENRQDQLDRVLVSETTTQDEPIEETVVVAQFSGGGAVAIVSAQNAFVRAAQDDDLDALSELLSPENVNLRDKQSGTTALEHAVKNANREMVQFLLDAGADVNLKDAAGETVLMMLDSEATADLVWDLINAGAKVNDHDEEGTTPLMRVAAGSNTEALKVLLDAGAEINARDKHGQTALMIAASEGNVNTVRALVLAGADINAVNEDKADALALAEDNDHATVVRFLKSKGAIAVVRSKKEE
jgi:hypothetical protein